jgi:hypothetical protein
MAAAKSYVKSFQIRLIGIQTEQNIQWYNLYNLYL